MTLLTALVTYYLRCLTCEIRFESYSRDSDCPVCESESRVYGLLVDDATANHPER